MTLDDLKAMAASLRDDPGYVQTCLCDAVNALLALVEVLPRCEAAAGCGPATRDYDAPGQRQLLCDRHDPTDDLYIPYPYRQKYMNDMPYAAILRNLHEGHKS